MRSSTSPFPPKTEMYLVEILMLFDPISLNSYPNNKQIAKYTASVFKEIEKHKSKLREKAPFLDIYSRNKRSTTPLY